MRGVTERALHALPDGILLFAASVVFIGLSMIRVRHYPLN
jgi:hypothetical protein